MGKLYSQEYGLILFGNTSVRRDHSMVLSAEEWGGFWGLEEGRKWRRTGQMEGIPEGGLSQ